MILDGLRDARGINMRFSQYATPQYLMIFLAVAKLAHLRVPLVDAVGLFAVLVDARNVTQLHAEPIVGPVVQHARLVDRFARVGHELHLVHVVRRAYRIGRKVAEKAVRVAVLLEAHQPLVRLQPGRPADFVQRQQRADAPMALGMVVDGVDDRFRRPEHLLRRGRIVDRLPVQAGAPVRLNVRVRARPILGYDIEQ